MVMMKALRLVRVGGVKGDTLVDIGIAVPDPVTPPVAARAAVRTPAVDVGKGVGGVKQCHTIDEVAN